MDKRKPSRKPRRTDRPRAGKGRRTQPHNSLSAYRQDPQAVAAGLERLVRAVAALPADIQSGRLSCEECQALLEFYLDAERQGDNVQARYPDVWKHLQACDRCRIHHELLTEALTDTGPKAAASEWTAPTVVLPFLSVPGANAPWSLQIHSRLAGGPPGFRLSLQRPFLSNRLASRPSLLAVRDANPTPQSVLLLSHTFALEQRDIDLELRAARSEAAEQLSLEVYLVSSDPLPEPLQVALVWNDHRLVSVICEGRASFEGIPVSDLEKPGDLHLEFQIGSETAKVERHAFDR